MSKINQDVPSGQTAAKSAAESGHSGTVAQPTTASAATNVVSFSIRPTMATDPFGGKWKSKVKAAKTTWGRLSESELLKSGGEPGALTALVVLRYSLNPIEARKQVQRFIDKTTY